MSKLGHIELYRTTPSVSYDRPPRRLKTQLGLVVAFALSLFMPHPMLAQVKSVTAGDSSIQIAGTEKNPTVAVADSGITNAKVANGALSPSKISGTAATLGSNDFTANQTITIGDLDLAVAPALVVTTVGPVGIRLSSSAGEADVLIVRCTAGPGNDCNGVSVHGDHIGVLASGSTAVVATASDVAGTGVTAFSSAGTAGRFRTESGNILIGESAMLSPAFRVDAGGKVFASAYNIGGADFAESVEPTGLRDQYQSGDVVTIDQTAHRRVTLAREPYSTLVAGIYSTKPGLLASQYAMDDPRLVKEIPLAVVGIVPCHVSAENGPIRAGDLLVTSATPGYAMKGTDRNRMLGAVVGKALEPLASGKGVIQVLVTLQ
jgi:hypothetical protein